MKKLWALMVLGAIVFGASLPSGNAGQKRPRSTTASHRTVETRLGSVEQFKEAFQNGAGEVRLVALISPT
jgi:hypothetical protein